MYKIYNKDKNRDRLRARAIYIYIICTYTNTVAEKSSDVYVNDRVINLHFLVGGGTFVVGPFFKNTLVHSDLRGRMLSVTSIKLHFWGWW